MEVIQIIQKSLMITAFVTVMMLVVEYLNVRTQGVVMRVLERSREGQYLLAALFGALPGCLGAYVIVALYAHRKVTLGALVASMIATSGDEAFVMLTLFPWTAVLLTLALAIVGFISGWVTDRVIPNSWAGERLDDCCSFDVHDSEDCRCYPRGKILTQWKSPSPYRATLTVALAIASFAVASGLLGPAGWGWKRLTLLFVMSIGLFITATVPDHFLEEHLWRHVALRHVPRIFFWTFGVLGAVALLQTFIDLGTFVEESPWFLLTSASLLGVIPESGPHLIFVTMYADGALPLSILAASSIVQDGHGMLPMLSASKRAFVVVKLINLIIGLGLGAILLRFGV